MAKQFKDALNELLIHSEDWPFLSIRAVPPGVINVIESYQAAAYRLNGPGNKPNRAEAVIWLTAVALSDGDAMGKIAEMNNEYLAKEMAAIQQIDI